MHLAKSDIKTPLTPIDFLQDSNTENCVEIEVFIKREDLNHPEISGNKWYKLKHNLIAAQKHQAKRLITFGGAYSNHIAATAAAAKQSGLKSLAVIRGEELAIDPEKWSLTLQQAHKNGMQFEFVSRQEYRQRHSQTYQQQLLQKYPDSFLIPEGGSNDLAILGFESLMLEINQQCPDWTHLYCAVGTGATLAGLIRYANTGLDQPKNRKIFGVAVLKQADYLLQDIECWSQSKANGLSSATKLVSQTDSNNPVSWQLLTEYHGGGYAKQTQDAAIQQQQFEQNTGILLDPIYTHKVIAAVQQEWLKGHIETHSKVIILHSGGLQGRFREK